MKDYPRLGIRQEGVPRARQDRTNPATSGQALASETLANTQDSQFLGSISLSHDPAMVSLLTMRRCPLYFFPPLCGLLAQGEHGDLVAMSIGRRSRSIPAAIRRALRLRDRGCRFPGCTHGRFLHGHHIRHWLHGGETSLDNLLLVCSFHHHLVHEGGWSVARTEDGELSFIAPDGHALPAVPGREATQDSLAVIHVWAIDPGLERYQVGGDNPWSGAGNVVREERRGEHEYAECEWELPMNADLARRTYGAIALLAFAGAAPKAQAGEPAQGNSEEAVFAPDEVQAREWYGLPTLVIDVAALGVFVGGVLAADHHSDASGPLVLAGLGGYVVGGPIVHLTQHRVGMMFASLGLRVGAPLAGMGFGAIVGGVYYSSTCHTDGCGLVGMALGAAWGLLGGLLVGSVVDITALARKPVTARQLKLSVLPMYKPTTGQAGVALRGTW